MEKLIINNFQTIKHAEIDINKFNIIIGPQAEGKSLICKLVFFSKLLRHHFAHSILNQETKKKFDDKILTEFYKIFPFYALNGQIFDLKYYFNSNFFRIYSKKNEKDNIKIYFEYSNEIKNTAVQLKKKYALEDKTKIQIDLFIEVYKFFHICSEKDVYIEHPVFIPAGRSFFANIQTNVWSLLLQDISIDFFLKDFGKYYQQNNSDYENIFYDNSAYFSTYFEKIKNEKKLEIKKIKNIITEILKGEYHRIKNEDRLYFDSRYIKISDSSSGQQEFFPMAVTISSLSLKSSKDYSVYFFIEEPEAHLFPVSQKHIIELFSLLFNISYPYTGFFISTHSPYILTSINNLIMAGNTVSEIEKKNHKNKTALLKKVYKIVDKNKILRFDDISVYSLNNGIVKDIKDYEYKLIDANSIDEVSNDLDKEFSELLDIQYGDMNET